MPDLLMLLQREAAAVYYFLVIRTFRDGHDDDGMTKVFLFKKLSQQKRPRLRTRCVLTHEEGHTQDDVFCLGRLVRLCAACVCMVHNVSQIKHVVIVPKNI